MGHAVEQDHDGDGSAADWQNHPGEDGPVVGAIQFGALLQLGRNGLEVGAHNNEVEDADQAGQQCGKAGVQKAHVPHHQVGGDHAAVEKHSKGDQQGEGLFEQQILVCQCIGQHGRQHHIEEGAHNGIKNGVEVAGPDLRVLEYLKVGV